MNKKNKSGMKGFFIRTILSALGAIFLARISRIICEKIAENNIIPEEDITNATFILLIILMFVGNKIINRIFGPYYEPDEDEMSEYEAIELEKRYKENGIYLIEANALSLDKVYKVVLKDNNLYFCKVGGQFYEIDEEAIEYTKKVDENILLKDKSNFKLPRDNIRSITLINKKSMHTGSIPNNGIVMMYRISEEKPKKYIIHMINEFWEIENYFRGIGKIKIDYKSNNK